jgi:hypothetical protein
MNPTPIPQNAVGAVLLMLQGLDALLDLGGKLVSTARQTHPELDTSPIEDEGARMDDARDEALRRALAFGHGGKEKP